MCRKQLQERLSKLLQERLSKLLQEQLSKQDFQLNQTQLIQQTLLSTVFSAKDSDKQEPSLAWAQDI